MKMSSNSTTVVFGLFLLGAGCVPANTITRCFDFADDPDGTQIILTYPINASASSEATPATLVITDPVGGEPVTIEGAVQNGRFNYPDIGYLAGDYWTIEEDRLVGYEDEALVSGLTTIDGVVVTESKCK